MKQFAIYATALALTFTSNAAIAQGAGELTPAKRTEIKALLELTGVRAIPDQIATNTVQSMVGGVRQLDPKFPDKGFVAMRDAMKTTLDAKVDAAGGLIEQVSLVYHNAFTAAEISELLKFYQGPVGKKMLGLQAKVNSETFQTAMRWADSLATEVDAKMDAALKKENLKLPDPPKQAAPAAPKAPAKADPASKK